MTEPVLQVNGLPITALSINIEPREVSKGLIVPEQVGYSVLNENGDEEPLTFEQYDVTRKFFLFQWGDDD